MLRIWTKQEIKWLKVVGDVLLVGCSFPVVKETYATLRNPDLDCIFYLLKCSHGQSSGCAVSPHTFNSLFLTFVHNLPVPGIHGLNFIKDLV